jgi:hypothetical protein
MSVVLSSTPYNVAIFPGPLRVRINVIVVKEAEMSPDPVSRVITVKYYPHLAACIIQNIDCWKFDDPVVLRHYVHGVLKFPLKLFPSITRMDVSWGISPPKGALPHSPLMGDIAP